MLNCSKIVEFVRFKRIMICSRSNFQNMNDLLVFYNRKIIETESQEFTILLQFSIR